MCLCPCLFLCLSVPILCVCRPSYLFEAVFFLCLYRFLFLHLVFSVYVFFCVSICNILFHSQLQVYEAVTGRSQVNMSSPWPRFTLEGLTPGLDYVIRVSARNSLGHSPPVRLEAFTYKLAANTMSTCWERRKESVEVLKRLRKHQESKGRGRNMCWERGEKK